ncbi:MAG: hypothetical protein R2911_29025 [Caldilineaceae bacterium]
MTERREWVVIGLLFAVLAAASIFFQQGAQAPPYDPDSAAPSGLLALRLWLRRWGIRCASCAPICGTRRRPRPIPPGWCTGCGGD